jgi:hypothetical protein
VASRWHEDDILELDAGARFQWSETEDDDDIDLSIYESTGRYRIRDEAYRGFTMGYELIHLDLATTDPLLPERLIDTSAAVGLDVFKETGWRLAVTAGGGFAGDTPFSDRHAWYAKGSIVSIHGLDEQSELMLSLFFDGNSVIFPDVPLPAIAYSRRSSDTLSYTVGLPFSSIRWVPVDKLTLSFGYALLTNFSVMADYEFIDTWHVFASFGSRTDAFHLENDDEHRRLFFEQRRAEAGLRWEPCRNASLLLAGGFAFDQEFSRGFDLRDTDEVQEIDDAPYLRAAISLSF